MDITKKDLIKKATEENGFFLDINNIDYTLDGKNIAKYLTNLGFNVVDNKDLGRNGLVVTEEGLTVSTNGYCKIINSTN